MGPGTSGTDADISGARDSTYTLVADDEGKKIKVKVSFLDTEATTNRTEGPLTSAATATVSASTNTPATGAPTITGTAQVGQTLTAGITAIMDAEGLTTPGYTYQWIRTAAGVDTNISGATASTYTLVAADLGTTVKVRVSFTDDASNAETLTSAATAAVSAAPNTLPSASNGTVTTNEDNAHTFTASEFNFSDADGDTLSNVRIVTLPASGKGTLALSGTPVTANQVVAATNIGTLAYTPPANANGTGYASFTFKVSDGTAESAADYTMTINVTAVNDAPTVANTMTDQPATVGTAFSYAFPGYHVHRRGHRRHAELHGDESRRHGAAHVAGLHRRHAHLLGHAAGRGHRDGGREGDRQRRQRRVGQRRIRYHGCGGPQRPLQRFGHQRTLVRHPDGRRIHRRLWL